MTSLQQALEESAHDILRRAFFAAPPDFHDAQQVAAVAAELRMAQTAAAHLKARGQLDAASTSAVHPCETPAHQARAIELRLAALQCAPQLPSVPAELARDAAWMEARKNLLDAVAQRRARLRVLVELDAVEVERPLRERQTLPVVGSDEDLVGMLGQVRAGRRTLPGLIEATRHELDEVIGPVAWSMIVPAELTDD